MPSIKVGAGIAHLPAVQPRDISRNRYDQVPLGRVRLIPKDAAIDAIEGVVNGVCLPATKNSGLVVTPRDGQTGVVEYAGTDPDRYTLPIMLDAWTEGITQQPYMDALMDMAGGPENDRPTLVAVIGSVPPRVNYRFHQQLWWIESISPVEADTLYGPDTLGASRLMRQPLVLTLLKPSAGEFTASPVKKAQKTSGKKTGAHVYVTARSGDSLLTIASRTGKKWNDLAALNGIRDPSNIHAGQRIRVS